MQIAAGPVVVEAKTAAKAGGTVIGAFLLAVLLLFVVAAVAFNKDHTVEVDCGGPTVSKPLTDKGLDVSGKIGDSIHNLTTKAKSTTSIVLTVFGMFKTIRLWLDNFTNHTNGRAEDSAATGWRNKTKAEQEKALASCCPPPPVQPKTPSPGTPPQGQEPFDPKQLAFQTRRGVTTGPDVAAAALQRAGFPGSEIPMGVAVAKYETGWRNIPGPTVRGSTMRGMWQINWNVHPEVHGFGDWRDPYANARMAYAIWEAAGKSWSPWSTARTARQHVEEFRQYGGGVVDAIPLPNAGTKTPTPPKCVPATTPQSDTPGGSVTGTIQAVRSYGRTYRVTVPSGKSGKAIRFALAQLGEPYVFSAHGPNAWDCSGLVSGAWADAGVRVPAQTYGMLGRVPEVSRSQMRPGDLAWWYGNRRARIGHVAIYLGDGLIVEAPRPGLSVRVRKLTSRPDKVLRPLNEGAST